MDNYPIRTAQTGVLRIISASSSTAVQIGDRGETHARLRAIAVQRADGGDVYFEAYRLFYRAHPVLNDPVYDNGELIQINRVNASPAILASCVYVIAASSSASIQIGNGMRYIADSRIKHIRQFKKPDPLQLQAGPQQHQPDPQLQETQLLPMDSD